MAEACGREVYVVNAISQLLSFNNPAHELAVRDYLAARLPDVQIVLSHQVSPEWREFERTSTTFTDADLAPVVRRYISTLQSEMGDCLPEGGTLHEMESNGGVMTAAAAAANPLLTPLSGPVGRAAIRGKALSAMTGRGNPICVDMGGTSFDASLVIDGLPSTSTEAMLEGLPVQMSVVDIHVIGAGGGSIAWKEAAAVRVGPQSLKKPPQSHCCHRARPHA